MGRLVLKPHWIEFAGTGEPALDHTFAYVDIQFDGKSILSIVDKRARSANDRLLVPLYPLAEWVAARWWALIREPLVPGRKAPFQEYLTRHSFRFAGDGFAFPDLRILPEGAVSLIQWRPLTTLFQSVDFISQGEAYLPGEDTEQFLADLVNIVLTRLESEGITKTWLAEEWAAINVQTGDAAAFCAAAGTLGLDPFDLDDATAADISRAWESLPDAVRPGVFEATDPGKLRQPPLGSMTESSGYGPRRATMDSGPTCANMLW